MQHPLKCFLIDNDEEDHEIFRMAMEEVDPDILCYFADNGISAINKLKNEEAFKPSCIFIDMNMPLMNGNECLQEIKKIERLHEVPVYIYSTAADPVTIAKAKQSGAADIIIKPASFKGLTELLSTLFKPQKQ